MPLVAAPYTLRNVQELLGLPRGVIVGLISAGYVNPVRGPRNQLRFTFQDVVLLRTAHRLRAAHVPQRRLMAALSRLRSKTPTASPLTSLRLTAVGAHVAVRDGDVAWRADNGQLVLDFEDVDEGADRRGVVDFVPHSRPSEDATSLFAKGEYLEQVGQKDAAVTAYLAAIELDPLLIEAQLNLGVLLCAIGRCSEAVVRYESAISVAPSNPLLRFNYAIALEDRGRVQEALQSYEVALKLDPFMADAHYNAAALCEALGDSLGAIRHFSAYRRLERLAGEDA